MPIVFTQPGVAVDWDWGIVLTLWSNGDDRIGSPLANHRLSRRPSDERQATAQARRWWRARGGLLAEETAQTTADDTMAGPAEGGA